MLQKREKSYNESTVLKKNNGKRAKRQEKKRKTFGIFLDLIHNLCSYTKFAGTWLICEN